MPRRGQLFLGICALAIGLVAAREIQEQAGAVQPDHIKLVALKFFPPTDTPVVTFPKPLPLPLDILPKFGAALIDENTGYAVIDVPSSNADGLAAALRPYARSVEERQDFDLLKFESFPIDATSPEPSYPPAYTRPTALPSPARDAFVIQFAAPARPEWLNAIKAIGATIVDYVPENGYTLLAAEDSLRQTAASLPVQFLRIHQPVHKITADLRATELDFVDVSAMVLKVPEAADALAFLDGISVAQPQSTEDFGDRIIYRRTVASRALPQLAQFPAVTWIEPMSSGKPSGEREVHLAADDPSLAGSVGGKLAPLLGNYRTYLNNNGLRPGYEALTVGIIDTGWSDGDGSTLPDLLSDTNTNLVTAVNYTNHAFADNDCYGHGTMVAGVVAGNGGGPYSTTTKDTGGFYMGLGMAPGIKLVSGRIFNYLQVTPVPPLYDPSDFRNMYADLVSRGVKIVNNSWTLGTLHYEDTTAMLDKIVRHAASESDPNPDSAPSASIIFATGNTDDKLATPTPDPGQVTAPGIGKNVIGVGVSENNNPATYPTAFVCTNGPCSQDGNQIWANYTATPPPPPTPTPTIKIYSRFGPTYEETPPGRIKPDLVAPGTAIEAPKTGNTLACQVPIISPDIDSPGQHVWSRGASFSAPVVTGAAALIYYWFQNRFSVTPEPSLLKATLINFAYDMYAARNPSPNRTKTPTPNPPITGFVPENHQGWGKVDLARAFKTDGRYAWANQQYLLTTSAPTYQSATLAVKDTTRPVRITLVWTDAPGGTVGKRLVNDLDLIAYNPSTLYYCAGNNFDQYTGRSAVFYIGPQPNYDRTNDVEQITFMASDLGTNFVVQITASYLNADALTVWGTSTAKQQDFAVFVDNVIGH